MSCILHGEWCNKYTIWQNFVSIFSRASKSIGLFSSWALLCRVFLMHSSQAKGYSNLYFSLRSDFDTHIKYISSNWELYYVNGSWDKGPTFTKICQYWLNFIYQFIFDDSRLEFKSVKSWSILFDRILKVVHKVLFWPMFLSRISKLNIPQKMNTIKGKTESIPEGFQLSLRFFG